MYYDLARWSGSLAFVLMFFQMFLGLFMDYLRPIFGSRVLKVHIWQGIIAFVLTIAHPLFFIAQFGLGKVLALGSTMVVLGKIALVLAVLAAMAGMLRTTPYLAKYWRWVHRLNYGVFALVYIHSWSIGSDARSFPLVVVYYLAPITIVLGVGLKLKKYLTSNPSPEFRRGEQKG